MKREIARNLYHPLPFTLAMQATADAYDPGESDITITSLLAPIRPWLLNRDSDRVVAVRAADQLYSWVGTLIHDALEAEVPECDLGERRFYMDVYVDIAEVGQEGVNPFWKIGGKFDYCALREGRLWDYKYTTKWSYIFDNEERPRQLKLYALLLRKHSIHVESAHNFLMLRDWSETEAARQQDYPPSNLVTIDTPITDKVLDETEVWLRDRVSQFAQALHQHEADGALPECTAEERWDRDTAHALYTNGNQKASVVFKTDDPAEVAAQVQGAIDGEPVDRAAAILKAVKGPHHYTIRPGQSKRCQKWCDARDICEQAHQLQSPESLKERTVQIDGHQKRCDTRSDG